MRRVLVGTPAHDGRVEVYYVNSLVQTIKLCEKSGIDLRPVFLSYDSLIQNARNDLVKLGIEGVHGWVPDDLIFIDGDQDWQPEWVVRLLNYPVDVVGGTVRKKTDERELYNAKHSSLDIPVDAATGLLMVDALGTGFLRFSRKALQALWDDSEPYCVWGKEESRWIFHVAPIDGQLVGEDTMVSMKLSRLGFQTYLDSSMTCAHIGAKRFVGDFAAWLAKTQAAARAA